MPNKYLIAAALIKAELGYLHTQISIVLYPNKLHHFNARTSYQISPISLITMQRFSYFPDFIVCLIVPGTS